MGMCWHPRQATASAGVTWMTASAKELLHFILQRALSHSTTVEITLLPSSDGARQAPACPVMAQCQISPLRMVQIWGQLSAFQDAQLARQSCRNKAMLLDSPFRVCADCSVHVFGT